jgi:hypothetical protein
MSIVCAASALDSGTDLAVPSCGKTKEPLVTWFSDFHHRCVVRGSLWFDNEHEVNQT